jgi:hypothetical protein
VGYWAVGLLGVVGAAGAGLALHGCSCGDTVYGLHKYDRVQTTIVAPYMDAGGPAGRGLSSCGSLGDLPAGTVLGWTANLTPEGEGPGCAGWGLSIGLDHINGAWAPAGWPPSWVDAGAGCTGTVGFDIRALGSNPDPSVFVALPDGGPVPWVLERFFYPDPGLGGDGGACPVMTPQCADAFVARSKKL